MKLLDQEEQILSAKRILDVGCGDARWWKLLLPDQLDRVHGIDISQKEIELARKLILARQLDVTSDEFKAIYPEKAFDLIIGNCSIEHIYALDKALGNISSRLAPAGYFILFVPTPTWALKGWTMGVLHKISPRLSMALSGFMNGFFQHWHLYDHTIWESILQSSGLKVQATYGIGNKKAEFYFRLFLIPALLSFLVKKMTGKYLNSYLYFLIPGKIFDKVAHFFGTMLDDGFQTKHEKSIFEYVIICRKP